MPILAALKRMKQDPIQKDTILLNYCIDDIEAQCRKLRESRSQVPNVFSTVLQFFTYLLLL